MIFETRSTLEYGVSDRYSDGLEEDGERHLSVNEIIEQQGHVDEPANAPIPTQPNYGTPGTVHSDSAVSA